jgi:nicotinamidase-related amidase
MNTFFIRVNRFRWSVIALALIPLSSIAETANRALVVIDMQSFFVTRGGHGDDPANVEKVKQILDAQIEAIQAAKQTNTPIIFFEYASCGATNDKLKEAAEGAKDLVYFVKTTDNMLDERNSHKKELVDYLEQKKIDTLIITGANGGACVERSIGGALGRNMSVIAYDKAIADFNYDEFLYPYDHYYHDRIHPNCTDCTFRETSDLKDIFPQSTGNREPNALLKVLEKSDEVHQRLNKMNPTKGCEK